jgi:hypothetical protein
VAIGEPAGKRSGFREQEQEITNKTRATISTAVRIVWRELISTG